jgi:hypothetical protein
MGTILRIEGSLSEERPWESLSSNFRTGNPRQCLPISAKNGGILPQLFMHLIPGAACFDGHSSRSLS